MRGLVELRLSSQISKISRVVPELRWAVLCEYLDSRNVEIGLTDKVVEDLNYLILKKWGAKSVHCFRRYGSKSGGSLSYFHSSPSNNILSKAIKCKVLWRFSKNFSKSLQKKVAKKDFIYKCVRRIRIGFRTCFQIACHLFWMVGYRLVQVLWLKNMWIRFVRELIVCFTFALSKSIITFLTSLNFVLERLQQCRQRKWTFLILFHWTCNTWFVPFHLGI